MNAFKKPAYTPENKSLDYLSPPLAEVKGTGQPEYIDIQLYSGPQKPEQVTEWSIDERKVKLPSSAPKVCNAVAVMCSSIENAPIDRLYFLRDGWDGYRAPSPSKTLIRHARRVWELAKKYVPTDAPRVNPHPDSYVTFSWSDHYPIKELQLSIANKKLLQCNWVLRGQIGKSSGVCETEQALATLLDKYEQYSNDGK